MPPLEVTSATSYASPSTHGWRMWTVSVSSRPIGSSAPVNCAKASLTTAWAIVDRVRPVVADRDRDLARLEHRALHRELLRRRAGALGESRPVEQREGADRRDDQDQRDEAEQPGRQAGRALPLQIAVRRRVLAHPLTSKKPCQPSSVNSDWCAWNMNFPAWGKRHSRIPRWPWQSITVSVNSDGVVPVPVGK